MKRHDKPLAHTAFHDITPDSVITLVEKALNIGCTNLCRPLNSYINRVYELKSFNDQELIVKFYRPGRWSKSALQDEHNFLSDLNNAEIPVIAPLVHLSGSTIGTFKNINFAIFPKKGGRSYDEYLDEQWLELGRLLGRTHAVGAKYLPEDRITLAPEKVTMAQLEYIINGNFIPNQLISKFKEIADSLIKEISPFFNNIEMIRIHGDCHFSNLIYRPNESFFIIDFDDMAVGPPVHDFWMLLPGYQHDCPIEIELFLEGYEMFREFDHSTLHLIEPLRAMRYIHYMNWCAHQKAEDGLSRVVPDFGTEHYWQKELNDLTEQLQRIRHATTHPVHCNGNRL